MDNIKITVNKLKAPPLPEELSDAEPPVLLSNASTVTVAVAIPVFPAASVAEKVTVVVSPAGKVAGAPLVTVTLPSTSSVADKKILAALKLESADILPLTMNDVVSGVLIIGWKLSSFKGKEKDQETLMLFANQASLILGPSKKNSGKKETKKGEKKYDPP